jgi:hypothetical protein
VPVLEKIISRHGDWIEGEYVNANTKIRVICEARHDWWVVPGSIKKGHWCLTCAGKSSDPKQRSEELMIIRIVDCWRI